MFWRKKTAWYWKALLILIVLRLIYAVAKFFMTSVEKHAGNRGAPGHRNK